MEHKAEIFIALASTEILFLLLLHQMHFDCYGNVEFCRLIMGKMKIGFNCSLIAGILTNFILELFVE